jgi:hypothetical protein
MNTLIKAERTLVKMEHQLLTHKMRRIHHAAHVKDKDSTREGHTATFILQVLAINVLEGKCFSSSSLVHGHFMINGWLWRSGLHSHHEGMKLYNTFIHIQILSNVESNAEGIKHYRMALKAKIQCLALHVHKLH